MSYLDYIKNKVKENFQLEQHLEGGRRTASSISEDPNAPFYERHRRMISFLIPGTIVWVVWWSYMISTENSFDAFTGITGSLEKPRWLISITMVFGALVAGATSEGGAAIAFPVLTLTMGVAPAVARDFSYLIQSVGMTSAAFAIVFMGVKVEWKSLIWCTLGGIGGTVLGLELVAPELTPPFNKMYFVSIWAAFAFSLFWMNRLKDIRKVTTIENWDEGRFWEATFDIYGIPLCLNLNWKALTLLAFGILGGVFTGMSGSGIDICSFAVLTLLFRINERIATPTSVVLMAINTVFAYFYRTVGMKDFNNEAYQMLIVAAPIVCIMAPVGSILSSHFHSSVLAWLIYFIDAIQFLGALIIIKPWLNISEGGKTDEPGKLCWSSSLILVSGAIFFTLIAKIGVYILAPKEEIDHSILSLEEGNDDKVGNRVDRNNARESLATEVGATCNDNTL
jgi:uncharacterized membrane protein YfcA